MKKRLSAFVCTATVGKLELRNRFYGRWAEKSNRKSPRGAPIIWRMRVKQEKKKMTPEPSNTLGGIIDGFVWLSGFSLRRTKRKKKKKHFFVSWPRPGLNPRPPKKWQKRLIHARSLVPRSEASPEKCGA